MWVGLPAICWSGCVAFASIRNDDDVVVVVSLLLSPIYCCSVKIIERELGNTVMRVSVFICNGPRSNLFLFEFETVEMNFLVFM